METTNTIRNHFATPDMFFAYVENDYMSRASMQRIEGDAQKDPVALLKNLREGFQKFVNANFQMFWEHTNHDPKETIAQNWEENLTVATFKASYLYMLKIKWVEEHYPESPVNEDPLRTPEAMGIWHKLQKKGWIDANLQPKVSHGQAAIIASVVSEMLGLEPRWEAIQKLWGNKFILSTEYSKSLDRHYHESFKQKVINALK